jgi:hypothetical protein
MKNGSIIFVFIFLVLNVSGQKNSIDAFFIESIDWYNKDFVSNRVMGTSVDKLYETLLKNKLPKKTVVVAVIDGGVDIHHKDLEGKIWVNADEIPGNNIDDDNNGYIDDINGWNYIGNSQCENVNFENLEYTRINKTQNKLDSNYNKAAGLYENELNKRELQKKEHGEIH